MICWVKLFLRQQYTRGTWWQLVVSRQQQVYSNVAKAQYGALKQHHLKVKLINEWGSPLWDSSALNSAGPLSRFKCNAIYHNIRIQCDHKNGILGCSNFQYCMKIFLEGFFSPYSRNILLFLIYRYLYLSIINVSLLISASFVWYDIRHPSIWLYFSFYIRTNTKTERSGCIWSKNDWLCSQCLYIY